MKFYNYQFTAEFSDSPNKINGGHLPRMSNGYFSDEITLLKKLSEWNRSGWRYYLTPDDIKCNANRKSKEYEVTDDIPVGSVKMAYSYSQNAGICIKT